MLFFLTLSSLWRLSRADIEGFIIGGNITEIEEYPHSIFLTFICISDVDFVYWTCGASILNQKLGLTAAHCITDCDTHSKITATVGNKDRTKGILSSINAVTVHENYEPVTGCNDIAVISLKTPFVLSKQVKKIALIKNPPYHEDAYVAGWGFDGNSSSIILKHALKTIWPTSDCVKVLYQIPKGCFCAAAVNGHSAMGDSGSAIVVKGFIQVGLVSYNQPDISDNITVYTDINYFYDWIVFNSKILFCSTSMKLKLKL